MAWWHNSIKLGRFTYFQQDARRRFSSMEAGLSNCVASHIIRVRVCFPFNMTIDEYAAFLSFSSYYLERDDEGAPIESYRLGQTVLMWHAAIWEYIGQTVNDLCGRVRDQTEVSFANATHPETIKQIPRRRISPIRRSELYKLAHGLRCCWGKAHSAIEIRHIGVHRYSPANLYVSDFDKLVGFTSKRFHHTRLNGLRRQATRSWKALLKAQAELVRFAASSQAQAWRPWWFFSD